MFLHLSKGLTEHHIIKASEITSVFFEEPSRTVDTTHITIHLLSNDQEINIHYASDDKDIFENDKKILLTALLKNEKRKKKK